MRWRGPDSGAFVEIAGYRLGVRRLAITDPEADQPMCEGVPGSAVSLIFNGSLAYPGRLRRSLASRGLALRTTNDAELALLAWRDAGVDGLRSLEGPFALALMDEERDELVLARDAFGEKPLFYANEEGSDWPSFASTVKALRLLLSECGSQPTVDQARVLASRGWLDWGEGLLGPDLREFPRGSVGVFRRGEAPVFHPLSEGTARAEAQELPLESLLLRSVEGRLHGDRPLGLLLSGGIDSACLALHLQHLGRQTLCLSLDLDGMEPESPRAARVAARLGLPHHRFEVGSEILDDLEGLIRTSGLPLADASLLATHRVCQEARAQGLGILLSGEGGDELFLGYRRQRAGPWLSLAQGLLPRPPRRAVARIAERLSHRRWGAGLRLAHALGREHVAYRALWSLAAPVDLDALFDTRGQRREAEETVADPQETLAPVTEELNGYLAYDLCPKLDCASLHAGVEARAPFLDARLLHRRPRHGEQRFETQGKGEIREILAQALPAGLRGGPKRGFGLPLHRWLPRWPRARTILAETTDLPWRREIALGMLDELCEGRGAHRAPLLYHLIALAIHLDDRRQIA